MTGTDIITETVLVHTEGLRLSDHLIFTNQESCRVVKKGTFELRKFAFMRTHKEELLLFTGSSNTSAVVTEFKFSGTREEIIYGNIVLQDYMNLVNPSSESSLIKIHNKETKVFTIKQSIDIQKFYAKNINTLRADKGALQKDVESNYTKLNLQKLV